MTFRSGLAALALALSPTIATPPSAVNSQGTSTLALTAPSLTCNTGSGNAALTIASGSKLCLDGATCSTNLTVASSKATFSGGLAHGAGTALTDNSSYTIQSGVLDIASIRSNGDTVQHIVLTGSGASKVIGAIADGSSAIGLKFGNSNSLTTTGAKIAVFYSDNASTERSSIDKNGMIQIGTGNTTAAPTCDSTQRFKIWTVAGGAGVKDTVQVCAKDATDTYAWRTIY